MSYYDISTITTHTEVNSYAEMISKRKISNGNFLPPL